MNPGFQIGSLFFHYYGLVLAAAILAAFLVAKFQAITAKISQTVVEELAIILIIPAIVGARIYHVIHFWDFYQQNPAQIFLVWQGGIGIIGAVLAGIITIFIYSKLKKIDFLKLTDVTAPALVLGQSIGRVGNFINQEGFGPPTNLPWGVFIQPTMRPEVFANSAYFHPTFFYESIGDFLIFLSLILIPTKYVGGRTAAYLILYSALRFGLEFLRIDTWQLGIIKVAQIVSVIGILAGAILIFRISNFNFKWITKFSH